MGGGWCPLRKKGSVCRRMRKIRVFGPSKGLRGRCPYLYSLFDGMRSMGHYIFGGGLV